MSLELLIVNDLWEFKTELFRELKNLLDSKETSINKNC